MLVWEKPCNCNLECAHTLETLIRATGPEYCSAFIAEPVVGATLGTVSAPERYFQIIRDIYNRYGILFIADEVKTGLGRTGKRWGLEHWEVKPDIIATAKALSSGYLSLGATIASDDIYEVFGEPFAHGHTYGSHPVACAAGAATLDYLIRNKLVERSAKLGGYLHEKLQDLYDLQSVGD
ncbi:MAG: aminotransferase class III-fold pyridoxal phosphate-dependent enzyme, partial [Candidatus Bathyarchaeia archaeon]